MPCHAVGAEPLDVYTPEPTEIRRTAEVPGAVHSSPCLLNANEKYRVRPYAQHAPSCSRGVVVVVCDLSFLPIAIAGL
jgi:hypothetical protein